MRARDKNYKEMNGLSFFFLPVYILFLSYILKMTLPVKNKHLLPVLFVILKQSGVGDATKKMILIQISFEVGFCLYFFAISMYIVNATGFHKFQSFFSIRN